MNERLLKTKKPAYNNQSKVKTNITLLPELRDKLEFAAYVERKERGLYRSVSDILGECAEQYLKEIHPDIEEKMKSAGLL